MNKNRVLRYNFNMVEVMLAIVIITLGISSVLVLFPVGLNANKGAVADNSIADIAEYVMAFVRAKSLSEGVVNSDSESNPAPFKSGTALTAAKIFCDRASGGKETVEDVEDLPSSFVPVDRSDRGIATLFKMGDGTYLIRQMSGPEGNRFVDFSAVARVYLDDDNFKDDYFPGFNKMEEKKTDHKIEQYLWPVVLELSWPADTPWREREKRYFRFEIFNTLYEPNPATT